MMLVVHGSDNGGDGDYCIYIKDSLLYALSAS